MTCRRSVLSLSLTVAAFAIPLTAGLTSCAKGTSTKAILIDGHRFVVPKEFLLPSQIPWFKRPKPSGQGFVFTNDPTLPLTEQVIVSVESRDINCRSDSLTPGSMLASACSWDDRAQQVTETSELRKELTYPGNDVFWTYTTQNPGAPRTIIAHCHKSASPNIQDSCSVFGSYSGLVYSFSIDDKNIAKVDQRRAEIESLLAKWEQR